MRRARARPFSPGSLHSTKAEATLSEPRKVLLIRSTTFIVLALLVLSGSLFGFVPELDLAAARLFWREGQGFIGVTPFGEMLRSIFYVAPFWIAGGATLGWIMRRLGGKNPFLPTGRALTFLALTLALAPGLLTNVILKDNSHRPRPVQTQDMGGQWEFRPWYRFDGQCERNCSFVSGETASAFWTLAPALITPLTVRPVAIIAAIVFGAATGLLRVAFGGHYLSDTIFAGLLTILIILGLYRLLLGAKSKESDLRDERAAL